MDRIWLKNYPPEVPPEIDITLYPSLVAMLDESFAKYRDNAAYVCMDKSLTYGDIDTQSRALGAWLQSRGLPRGARVAIMMPNVLQYPIAIAAVLRAGYAAVNVNPLYKPRELEFQLQDSGAEAIVVLENFASTLQQAIAATKVKHVVIASMGDLLGTMKGAIVNLVVRHVKKMVPAYDLPGAVAFNTALAQGRSMKLTTPPLSHGDLAFLQYTGGTTGVPKGAMLSHGNLIANALQVGAWQKPLEMTEPKVERFTIMTALPLYHIFALTACFFVGMRTGARCILIPNPRDIPNLIKECCKYEITMFPAVNTLFNALMHHPDFHKIDWSHLKCSVGGGMAVQKVVADGWATKTGRPVTEGYGLSETSPVLTCNRSDIAEFTGTIGFPVPSTEVIILGDDDRQAAIGLPGEICARGPQVMSGYWQRPDETEKVMTADGFFRTGDVGVMDEHGRIRIVDRKKDMIKVSGFNVYPNEVEDVVARHPGVLECAVIGLPDARTGEAVKVFIVKKDEALSEQDVVKFCASQLTNYKVPKRVEFRSDLPKSNVGKVLRRELRDEEMLKLSAAA